MEILQELYDSEINVILSWQWDGGVDWAIVQGFANDYIIESGSAKTVAEAVANMVDAAVKNYPDSTFAKNRNE